MAPRGTRPTIVDIARELDIHPTSVSRALRGSTEVSESTRSRVLSTAARLNYVRNVHAAGLVTGSSNTLGVLVPNLTNPFFAELANNVQTAAMARGYLVMVAASNMSSETEAELVARMIDNVDGTIVAIPTGDRPLPGDAARQQIGFVNRHIDGASCFLVDQHTIAQLQINALVAAGHTSIAFVDGPSVFESTVARQRFRRTMELDGVRFHELGTFDASGRDAADAYAAIPTGATAVVVFNDIMALGLIAAAMADGRRVPDDLSVVGSDGLGLAELFSPSLATVRAPLTALAEAVVDHLVRGDGLLAEPMLFQPDFVDGASVGPPRS